MLQMRLGRLVKHLNDRLEGIWSKWVSVDGSAATSSVWSPPDPPNRFRLDPELSRFTAVARARVERRHGRSRGPFPGRRRRALDPEGRGHQAEVGHLDSLLDQMFSEGEGLNEDQLQLASIRAPHALLLFL